MTRKEILITYNPNSLFFFEISGRGGKEREIMKAIDEKNKVNKETIRLYDEIDGLKVIEEFLLFKGTEGYEDLECDVKDLEKMAHMVYGLKVNATNKLYVGWHLHKFLKRNDMLDGSWVRIPKVIFDKAQKMHNEFKLKRQP
jgi:hypothetical protein